MKNARRRSEIDSDATWAKIDRLEVRYGMRDGTYRAAVRKALEAGDLETFKHLNALYNQVWDLRKKLDLH